VVEVFAQTGPVSITLPPTPSPATAEPSVTPVNLTASGFPSGVIDPIQVQVTLAPKTAGSGPAMTAAVSSVVAVAGSSRRTTFTVLPADPTKNVTLPTAYLVSLKGSTTGGVSFESSNSSTLTINPPASVTCNPVS